MVEEVEEVEVGLAEQLPTEVMLKILSCLSPRVTEFFFFTLLLTAYKDMVVEEEEEKEVEVSPVEQLPTEVMLKILSYLSPRDLSRCAQVSQHWNQLAMDPTLWPAIHPVQWAAGKADRLAVVVVGMEHVWCSQWLCQCIKYINTSILFCHGRSVLLVCVMAAGRVLVFLVFFSLLEWKGSL